MNSETIHLKPEANKQNKQTEKKDIGRLLRTVLPWVWLVGCYLVYVYFMWVYGEHLLDADNSSEMVYSALLAEEGKLITDSWWFSTEIRVLYFHLIMAPLLSVFSDWHLVRTVGSAICNFVLLLSYGYFCRGANLRKAFAISGALFLIPFSTVFFDYMTYGLQYNSYLTISFLTFGLLFRLCGKTTSRPRLIWRAFCLLLLSLLNGMAGLRELAELYLPVVLTAMLGMAVWGKRTEEENSDFDQIRSHDGCRVPGNRPEDENNDSARLSVSGKFSACLRCPEFSFLAWSLASTAAAVAGYAVNVKVLAERYSFVDYGTISYVELSFDRLVTCLDGIIKVFGYHEGDIRSGYTLINLVFGLLFLLTVYGAVKGIQRLLRGTFDARSILPTFFAVATVVYILLYLFTDMDCYDRYYIPVYAFAIPTMVCGALELRLPKRSLTGWAVAFMAVMTLSATVNYYYLHKSEADDTYYYRDLLAVLEEEGYTEGFSTYWSGNVLTELTDGRINMRVFQTADVAADGSIENINHWLQRKDNEGTEPEGSCFILFTQDEISAGSLAKYLDSSHIIYSTYKMTAYGYESYEDLTADLGTYSYSYTGSGSGYLSNGVDIMRKRVLYPNGGKSYGPDMTFYAGTYEVTIEGENLTAASVRCTWDGQTEDFDITVTEAEEDHITLVFETLETREDCEVVVSNPSDDILTLTKVTIEKTG